MQVSDAPGRDAVLYSTLSVYLIPALIILVSIPYATPEDTANVRTVLLPVCGALMVAGVVAGGCGRVHPRRGIAFKITLAILHAAPFVIAAALPRRRDATMVAIGIAVAVAVGVIYLGCMAGRMLRQKSTARYQWPYALGPVDLAALYTIGICLGVYVADALPVPQL